MQVSPLGGTPTMVVPSVTPMSLALDATRLYWGDGFDNLMAFGLNDAALTTLASKMDFTAQAIVVDATSVYFTGGSNDSPSDDAIVSVPLGGGAPQTLVPVTKQFGTGLVLQGSRLYWTTDGDVSSGPVGGGAATEIAGGQSAAEDIASDESFVYWTLRGGWVLKAPLGSGSTPVVLVVGHSDTFVVPIAVDATSVYWGSDQGLMKIAK